MIALSETRRLTVAAGLLISSLTTTAAAAPGAQVVFDLPPAIECRDVTPAQFAELHPSLKIVEGTLRISARFAKGTESEIVDFLYVIDNPNVSMRFGDYLPNTTLESAVADDRIEITDASEKANLIGLDAGVIYKPFKLGGTHSHSSKASESSRYEQIAPKELVLAAGTTNREHGVFFRLRPSRAASLEGAREFTFLATVPATWRGDLCSIECNARTRKSSLFSSSIAPAGTTRALVPVHMVGDAEASELVREYRHAQRAYSEALAAHARDSVLDTISSHTVGLLGLNKCETASAKKLAETQQVVAEVQERLAQLAN